MPSPSAFESIKPDAQSLPNALERASSDRAKWDTLAALAAPNVFRSTRTLEAKQRTRWQRYQLAALTSLLIASALAAFVLLGALALPVYLHFLAVTGAGIVLFGWLIRSGLNLRFKDPSLTMPMMLAALGSLLYVMANLSAHRDLVVLLYVLPFVFGTLRLDTRRLVWVALVTLAIDLAILSLRRDLSVELRQLELLRWLVLSGVLLWFSYMAGLLTRLRVRINATNERLAKAVDAIRHLATHDELTGVFNRRQLIEMIHSEMARSERYASPWSVCLVDLDYFKRVNDTLGHAAGDVVLRTFARAVQDGKRPTDTFGRYGGEEFLLVLSQTRLEQAQLAAERIRALAEQLPYDGLDPAFRVTVSAGVAEHRPGEDWQATVQRADEALYRAKQSGRNRVELSIDYEATINMSRTGARAVLSE